MTVPFLILGFDCTSRITVVTVSAYMSLEGFASHCEARGSVRGARPRPRGSRAPAHPDCARVTGGQRPVPCARLLRATCNDQSGAVSASPGAGAGLPPRPSIRTAPPSHSGGPDSDGPAPTLVPRHRLSAPGQRHKVTLSQATLVLPGGLRGPAAPSSAQRPKKVSPSFPCLLTQGEPRRITNISGAGALPVFILGEVHFHEQQEAFKNFL